MNDRDVKWRENCDSLVAIPHVAGWGPLSAFRSPRRLDHFSRQSPRKLTDPVVQVSHPVRGAMEDSTLRETSRPIARSRSSQRTIAKLRRARAYWRAINGQTRRQDIAINLIACTGKGLAASMANPIATTSHRSSQLSENVSQRSLFPII